jgi:hypothetical protein
VKIIFACTLVPKVGFDNMWVPKIQAVRIATRVNGVMFECRWSSFPAKGNKKYVIGLAEVTPTQQTACQADTSMIVILEAQFDDPFSSLSNNEQKRVNALCIDIGIAVPTPTETLISIFNRLCLAADGSTVVKRNQELNNDLTVKKAEALGLVMVGSMGAAMGYLRMNRRQILKLAAISGAAWMLRPRLAHSAVVFTDDFTIGGIDVDLDAHGTPDYSINEGASDGALVVKTVNNRVENNTSAARSARLLAAAAPTGDQKITATCLSATTQGYAGLLTRCDGTGTTDFYLMFLDDDLDTVELYRADAGALTPLVGPSRAVTYPATCSFEATGAGATITLQAIAGATAAVDTTDTDPARKTAGKPGLRLLENGGGNDSYIDDLSVEDLAGGGGSASRRITVVE